MMAKRWWKSERSLLAARVRSTRRRLRSSYRGTVERCVAAEVERVTQSLLARQERLEARLGEAIDEADRVVRLVSSTAISAERAGTSNRLLVEVHLSDELVLRPNARGVLDAIARVLGETVRRDIERVDVERLREVARGGRWRVPDEPPSMQAALAGDVDVTTGGGA